MLIITDVCHANVSLWLGVAREPKVNLAGGWGKEGQAILHTFLLSSSGL